MRDALLPVLVAASAYLGFALLALSQRRHWQRLASGGPPAAPLRVTGYGLLAASLGLAILGDGPGFGTLLWTMMLSLGAVGLVGTLTWRPDWLRPLARAIRGRRRAE